MNTFSEKYRFKRLHGAILLAAGVGTAVPSLAQSTGIQLAPMDVLPEVFSRLDRAPAPSRQTEQRATKPEDVAQGEQTEAVYAEQDLDLALQNFFYALEDLMQSASRYEAAIPSEQEAYIANVQFASNVMDSMRNSPSSDRATNTAVASNSPPPIQSRRQQNPTFFSDFSYGAATNISLEHNDNIFSSRENEEADQILRASFAGTAEKQSRTRALTFEGQLNSGNYYQNTDNNYLDMTASATFATLLGGRSKGLGAIAYSKSHEERGTGITEGDLAFAISQPLQFDSWVARGIYELGAPQARTRFVADGKVDLLRASNFQETEFVQARDRDITSITTTAYYKLTQRLSLLTELRHMDIEYIQDVDSTSSNSTQTRLAVGAEWDASRKTTGSVRIGLQEKQFDEFSGQDNSSLSWEASINWTPIPRTELAFETLKDTQEAQGFGAALDRTDFRIRWSQQWTPRVGSNMSILHGTSDYQQTTREDIINLLDSELTYSLSSRTSAILKLTYIDNSSNVDEYGFERTQIQLGVNLELD